MWLVKGRQPGRKIVVGLSSVFAVFDLPLCAVNLVLDEILSLNRSNEILVEGFEAEAILLQGCVMLSVPISISEAFIR